jgi:hypothetical protein
MKSKIIVFNYPEIICDIYQQFSICRDIMSDIVNNDTVYTHDIIGDIVLYSDSSILDDERKRIQNKNISFRNSYLYSLFISTLLEIEGMYEKLYDLYYDLYNEDMKIPPGKVTKIKDFFVTLKDCAPKLIRSEKKVIYFMKFMIDHVQAILEEAMCFMVKNFDNNWFILKDYR